MSKYTANGIDEMGEVVAGSAAEYEDTCRLLTDRELAVELRASNLPAVCRKIAATERTRRAYAKTRGERQPWW